MTKRNGVSLVNVMVFMLFAAMVTAQVFFFMNSSMESIAEDREILMYRLKLDTLVEEARQKLEETALTKGNPSATYETFYDQTKINWTPANYTDWENNKCHIAIHDLDYTFTSTQVNRTEWGKQSGSNMYKKIFAAMPVETEDRPVLEEDGTPKLNGDGTPVTTAVPVNRYYLIRAYATLPQKFYGQHLMYQVLVRRNEDENKVYTLSFQEVWF